MRNRLLRVVKTDQEELLSKSVNGGTQSALVLNQKIRISLMRPVVDNEMLEAAVQALQNEKLVLGESVFKFEEEFARFCGTRFAISTGSGTSALQITLQSLGIGYGDEVLTTPFSFFATSNAVIHAEAKPAFADVEDDAFNLDPNKVQPRVTPRTRSIIPVHLYGTPAKMDSLKEIAEAKSIPLIEDACQAHGAEYHGKRVGSIGEAGCFSFYTSKNMTVCGDGGMITTNNEELAEAARSFRDCGRSTKYAMARVGYTSRLNTVNAAIGRVQLKRLPEWNKKRQAIANLYRKQLDGLRGITLPPATANGETSVYHLFVIRSQFRDRLLERLKANGVEAGIHYPIPIHLQGPYRSKYGFKEGTFQVSEKLAREVLSLPLHPGLTEEEVLDVSQIVRDTAQMEATVS